MTVVKRNGMLVPFRRERIAGAIEAAFRATNQIPASSPLPQDVYTAVQAVTNLVVEELVELASSGACISVEGIQDVVEKKLMEGEFYDVARNYIIYRDEHKALREDSPQNLKILRRDGHTSVSFKPLKIARAIEKAFRASLNISGSTPEDIVSAVNLLTNKVVACCQALAREGTALHVELVQDEIEKQMMAEGYYQVAKDFILYRAERARVREAAAQQKEAETKPQAVEKEAAQVTLDIADPGRRFKVTTHTGETVYLSELDLRKRIEFACQGLEDLVDVEEVVQDSILNFYEGIKIDEVDLANIMAARAKVEKEPAYTYVTARLLLDKIYRETMQVDSFDPELKEKHSAYFKEYLKRGVDLERLDPALLNFDLERLAGAMNLERDKRFTYLGLQTLYDRYLIHHEERRIETPQIFWMRVAMGLSLNEGEQKNARAIEFYDVLSRGYFMSSTPTLFNSGTTHSQMSSCYLSTVMDDLQHIFKVIADDAQLSKWAGGLGNDWTNVRATGSRIKGTNGKSQGVIPFLKVANDTAVAVNQGGKRKGAMCAYLETWHLDIEDFLELRKNTGDERRRTHDMNTANWIPDLFMKRVEQKGHWTLFSPSDVPDLHDLYGKAFEKRYLEYEKMTETGKIKLFKRVDAVTLWRKMLSMLFETGHPWMTFKDPSNIRSPQDHKGVVHSSNLCTEILLNTSAEETAVCNLGSVNLLAHTTENGLNLELLEKTVRTAIRMLDNVIDINFYPTPEAERANKRHRPVGLGLMGFQDALYKQRISYASPEAIEFADRSMEAISYYAILASSELAAERGAYPSFKGSKWDRGLLPIDTIELLEKERGAEFVEVDKSITMDWQRVRDSIKKHGMRNSNTMAIAPTATISNITGVSQSIEPVYKHLFAKSNLSGEFIVHNPFLVQDLKDLGIWDDEMIDDLKYFDGSILEIERIPDELKKLYLTAFEIEPEWLIECASRRQKWIDMGQSLNLYISEPNGKKLHNMYMLAWRKGLKTTYYLRSLGATQIEKSTTDINKRGLQPRWMKNKSASSEVVVQREEQKSAAMPAATCNLDGDCESCQ
ncbi:MAG: ribonucleoside-diphosphate reductase subunit alpha [Candidatus Dadabacteria bacterium]|nr:MAG: ribonucleoside-diphosphate reductase subunit alpha [Candidatus Dadabacteria bacterium]